VLTWLSRRKTAASATVLAVLIATPVTIAVLHQGFPISDVDLSARDVWVTNGAKLLTGRLNMQIAELNGAASMATRSFDVMQDGTDVFVYDEDLDSIERIDPSYVSLGQKIAVPHGSEVTYGGSVITILRPSDGALWIVPADGELQFDPEAIEPIMKLGTNARAVATENGAVFAVSAEDGALYRIEGPGALPTQKATLEVDDYDLSAVGDRAVILDRSTNSIIKDDGGRIELPAEGIRLQQRGPAKDFVVVATGASLLRVDWSGGVKELDAGLSNPATSEAGVSAPVVLGSCIHGAWASSARYLGVCEGRDPTVSDIPGSTPSSELVFRVNRSVIALNNLSDGNVWLVTQSMRLVENWEEVTPPDLNEGEQGEEKASQQTFEETLANRTEQNQPPIARPDALGIRPGSTTILAVLDNDTDPDGDVLTISNVSEVSSAIGAVETIDGGRALQFVPSPGASGTVSFRYTVTDGRPGGVAEAQVDITIRPVDQNLPPVQNRTTVVSLEAGQDLTYNVLSDWIDPDGDDLQLISADSTTGDVVRFRPDGQLTFTHVSSELGQKSVTLTVSDGRETSVGEFIVDVKAAGDLSPVGVPDFASGFVSQSVDVSPLDNDRSPSGAPLTLVSVEPLSEGISTSIDLDHGVITATAGVAGIYYLKYTLAAGSTKTSIGLIRVDVAEDPENPLPPVAVKDIAYVRPNEPTMLSALANDQSPGGRVIGIQSVDIPESSNQLSVEILNSSILRISAPSGLTESLGFTYTISDGLNTSTAGVTVVPVPELTKHQAPIAADDTIKVRTGDIASVAVLDNDYHPDGARMLLDTDLVESNVGADGLAFVTGDQVRIQAPTEPGQYSVTYRIYDAFSESSVARVLFTVLDTNAENNQPPLPTPVTARVFQGGFVTIDLPLDGTDPDGDSVTFVGAAGAALGEITGQSSRAFTYQAYPDSAGTDTFTYQVVDTLGESATGQIRIGVLPRPDTVLPPAAVNDAISIRPGRVASVPVMGNDSDPNGYAISVKPELLEVQEGITASVDGENVVVEAGEDEGTFILRYQITNGHGGEDDAFVTVTVSADAPPQFPVAFDHVVETKDIIGAKTVDVDVLSDAQNPGGLVGDLVVSVEGANSASAEVLDDGRVRVTLGDTRQAIAFRLTNEIDDLSAMAFVVVPRYTSDLPPKLKPELEANPPVVGMNQTKEWKISDLVDVPSGRQARITNEASVSAGRSNGDPIYVDENTIRYTPEKDFRGQVQITFEVTDGSSENDPSGSKAVIQLPVIVGDPNFEDVAPTFSNSTVSIEAGEAATVIDLRAASSHPNPTILAQLAYSPPEGATAQIAASIAGSNLTVSAPFGVQPGTTTTLKFNVNYKGFSVPAEIKVNVVASTRPLAQAADDTEPEGRSSSVYTITPLDNDFNPFAAEGQALKITSATIEGAALGATVTNTASTVRVTTGTAKSGTISIIYTIRDATDTAAREVQGRITVVVASAPEPVTSISLSNPGSQTVTVVFQPPSSSNGAPITGWTVQVAGGPSTATRTDCVPGGSCTFSGRTNGASQTVTVAATNRVGTTWSGASSITPYGTPSVPSGPVLNTNSSTATATITPSWSGPADDGGGSITYNWNFTQGISASGVTGGTSGSGQSVGAGDYTFQVQACNPGGCSAYVAASRHIDVPPPSAWVSDGGAESGNPPYHWLRLTVANFPAGTYNVACYADGTNGGATPYKTVTIALPANGSVVTSCHAKTDPAPAPPGWLMIEIVGVMFTPHYTPWT